MNFVVLLVSCQERNNTKFMGFLGSGIEYLECTIHVLSDFF